MAFLIIPLRIFCRIVRVRDRSNKNLTVLQNYFPVKPPRMTDNRIDMADCSNRAAERDSVSDAKIKRASRRATMRGLTGKEVATPALCRTRWAAKTIGMIDVARFGRARRLGECQLLGITGHSPLEVC
jgi:hypothetical protein